MTHINIIYYMYCTYNIHNLFNNSRETLAIYFKTPYTSTYRSTSFFSCVCRHNVHVILISVIFLIKTDIRQTFYECMYLILDIFKNHYQTIHHNTRVNCWLWWNKLWHLAMDNFWNWHAENAIRCIYVSGVYRSKIVPHLS